MLANLPARTRNIIFAAVAILVILVGAWWFFVRPAQAATTDLAGSGNIEARDVRISPEVNARVVEVLVTEGQSVKAGDVLIKLDDSSLQSQYVQAKAALTTAQANLALLKAGPAPEQRALQVAQAQASVVVAQNALQDLMDTAAVVTAQSAADVAAATDALDKAQRHLNGIKAPDLTFYQNRVDDAQNALLTAQQNVTQVDIGTFNAAVKAAQDLVDDLNDRLGKIQAAINGCPTCDPNRAVTVDRRSQTLADAQDDYNGALNHLHDLELQRDQATRGNSTAIRDDQKKLDDARQNLIDAQNATAGSPNAILLGLAQSQFDLAKANLARVQDHYNKVKAGPDPEKLAIAQAQLAAAQAALTAAKAGPSAEQIAVYQAQLDTAQAQVVSIEIQLKKYVILAPLDAVVLARSIEPGEFTAPGATLFDLGHLDKLQLTVYLPEEKFALVSPGETATVHVDAYPNRTFTAIVTQLANQAEFTPRNVETVDGRKDTVYAIHLDIDNPDLALKPGMPADVSFGPK